MKKMLFFSVMAAILSGCSTINRNEGADANLRQWVVKDVVHHKISVDQIEVSATDKLHSLFGFINWGGSDVLADQSDAGDGGLVTTAKRGAYAKACEEAGCDQLAVARYRLSMNDYFLYKNVTAEVRGYPVKVTGVEVIENKTLAPARPDVIHGVDGQSGSFILQSLRDKFGL